MQESNDGPALVLMSMTSPFMGAEMLPALLGSPFSRAAFLLGPALSDNFSLTSTTLGTPFASKKTSLRQSSSSAKSHCLLKSWR